MRKSERPALNIKAEDLRSLLFSIQFSAFSFGLFRVQRLIEHPWMDSNHQ